MSHRLVLHPGSRYGKLTVLSAIEESYKGLALWLCRCDCGNEIRAKGQWLVSGRQTRCNQSAHAATPTMARLKRIWDGMKFRCEDTSHPAYANYGGRGIKICARWQDFLLFVEDMSKSHDTHLAEHGRMNTTLERIENDKDYGPSNCRWATRREQNSNRRDNVIFNGETAEAASRRLGLRPGGVSGRIKAGWSKEKAFNTPHSYKAL